MGRLTPEQLTVFVADSCERQGVPVKVRDVRVLADVATLLRGDGAGVKLGGRSKVVADDDADKGAQELGKTGS